MKNRTLDGRIDQGIRDIARLGAGRGTIEHRRWTVARPGGPLTSRFRRPPLGRSTAFVAAVGATLSWLAVFAVGIAPGADTDPRRPPAIRTENVPVVRDDLVERLRRYQETRSARFAGWASGANQGILIQTRFGNTVQLHRVYEPGGRREQITFFSEPVNGRFLPEQKNETILLSMGRGGDENFQLYRLERDSGNVVLLTDGKSRNTPGAVARDGSLAAFTSNVVNGRDMDLYLLDPRVAPKRRKVLDAKGRQWIPTDFSPDRKRLLLIRYVSINETYAAMLDLDSGRLRDLSIAPSSTGPSAVADLRFSSDGRCVYFISDFRGEHHELGRLDLESGAITMLAERLGWDVSALEVDHQSDRVAFVVNEGGRSSLYVLRGERHARIKVPLGVLSDLEFGPDKRSLGFTLDRPDAPADAYSVNLEVGRLVRWTFSETGGLNPAGFVRPDVIECPSFDGRKVPAFYFRPRGATKQRPAPVLLVIHGGPESQYRPMFSPTTQFYVNELGIAVVAPNVRGSAGYGKTYLKLDNAEKREDSVKDIGAVLDWIDARPELDASRVAVIGGSYGGYMVLASLVHFGARIKAGVDIVGIASFQTFLERTSAYRQDLRRAEYGDERDPKIRAFFARIDPANNAHLIRSALLVAHGRNDPRVPFSEAEQIVRNVRREKQAVWTVYADNEGHGFAKKDNSDYLSAVIVLFLERHLVGRGLPEGPGP